MQQSETEAAVSRLENLAITGDETNQQSKEDNTTSEDPSVYEETHVHSVYESIADHFSATRYSPWPLVARFLEAQPAGSIGLDVGCGNGKYLSGPSGNPDAAPNLFMLGSDRSSGLAKLAHAKHAQHKLGADVLLADSLALPFRDRCADFIICIAVVHHLSTRERRQEAVKELLRCVRPRIAKKREDGDSEETSSLASGSVLVYVWALEQASSRRGWAAGGDQDLLVPWVKTMKDKPKEKAKPAAKPESKSQKKKQRKQRQVAGSAETAEATEAAEKQPQQEQPSEPQTAGQPTPEPAQKPAESQKEESQPKEPFVPPTFHRYYHLYREGEVEEDVVAAGGRVVASGYEKDNWWVVADVL